MIQKNLTALKQILSKLRNQKVRLTKLQPTIGFFQNWIKPGKGSLAATMRSIHAGIVYFAARFDHVTLFGEKLKVFSFFGINLFFFFFFVYCFLFCFNLDAANQFCRSF